MNKTINKFSFTGDKFMPKLHLKQPRFAYSACGTFTKNPERIKKFREKDNLKHLCRNKIDKACFTHDAAYSDSKDLAKRTISGKILKGRAYNIDGDSNCDEYQRALANMVYKFFDQEAGSGISVNEQLAEDLRKIVIKIFRKRKVCAKFKDNVWTEDLAEIESLSSKNKNVKY